MGHGRPAVLVGNLEQHLAGSQSWGSAVDGNDCVMWWAATQKGVKQATLGAKAVEEHAKALAAVGVLQPMCDCIVQGGRT